MKRKSMSIVVLFSLFLMATTGCSNHESKMLETGDKLPDYKGVNTNGEQVALHDYIGNGDIVLVNFWAGWCGDCLKHNPELVALHERYKDFEIEEHNFKIVSISLDKKESQWKRMIERTNLNWPHHIADMKGYDSEQIEKFGITWIPSNYLVDHEGKVITRNVNRENFEHIVREYYE